MCRIRLRDQERQGGNDPVDSGGREAENGCARQRGQEAKRTHSRNRLGSVKERSQGPVAARNEASALRLGGTPRRKHHPTLIYFLHVLGDA